MGDGAHLLGMRPRDWDTCTVEETDELLDWLDAYEEAHRKAADELKKK